MKDIKTGHEKVREEGRQHGAPDHSGHADVVSQVATDRQVDQRTRQGGQCDDLDLVDADSHLNRNREDQWNCRGEEELHQVSLIGRIITKAVADPERQEWSGVDPSQKADR